MDFAALTSLVIFLPLLGALVLLALPSTESIKWTALGTTVLTFVASIGLFMGYDPAVSTAEMPQMAHVVGGWFPDGVDVKYFVGVDGLNILLVLLTTLLGPIVVLSSWFYIERHHKGYYALLLLLQTGVTGVFMAFDLVLFYVFFELTLIPMYFIIGIWGGEDRIYAAIKFVLYTLVGSLLMLAGVLFLGFAAGSAHGIGFTTDWYQLIDYTIPLGTQTWLFFVFALAFAIKVPLFPLHTWLPDAHVQAPTGGSVILAGVLLKMGTYGLIRFCLPFFPNAAQSAAVLIAVLAVIGIIYGALLARVQPDAKKLVAYSSVSHLGFVVLGIFAFTTEAMQGAVIQMINHGISTGALFLLVGMLYERRHTRLMEDYGGLATSVPVLTTFMILSVLASAGLPGLNGFVGEFMILLGSFKSTVLDSPVLIALATSGVILAAVYLLHMVYSTFFGELTHTENAEMTDMTMREFVLMAPLAILMLVMGFYPQPFLNQTAPTTDFLLETIEAKHIAAIEADRDASAPAASTASDNAPAPLFETSVEPPRAAPRSAHTSTESETLHAVSVPSLLR